MWDLGSAEAAELAKLAETTYRDVNIGLANQFALYADRVGVDFHRIAEACNSQPFSHLHAPGIAVGGHCIPVYPWFYLAGDPDATIVRAARAANSAMPERAVQRLADVYGDLRGATVVVLGACYRGGVKETAFSGVFGVVEALRARGAAPFVHDPLFTAAELAALGLEPYRDGVRVDAAVLQADHAGVPRLHARRSARCERAPRRARRARPRAVARRHGARPGAVDGRLTGLTAGKIPMSTPPSGGRGLPSMSMEGAPSSTPAPNAGLPGRRW